MINICVWSETYIEIEQQKYEPKTRDDMLIFIKAILDKAYYSGERLCLESVDIVEEKENSPKNVFTEIERW